MTVDEQEALSRRYENEVVSFLVLRSGNVAVFNSARELCAIIQATNPNRVEIQESWFPPLT